MRVKFWILVPLLALIFSPVFLKHFGAHTDGYYLITSSNGWLADPEGVIMYKQGRPLSAFLNSYIGGHLVNSVEDLTVLRIGVFLVKLLMCYFLYRFCRRLKMGDRWAVLMAFCFVLLPSNIINVIWVCNGVPESAGLLFGILSYISLNKCTSLKSWWNAAIAAILFLIALLFYQPMAVIVFGFMFLKLFFYKGSSWDLLRLRLITETFFYGMILFFYWFLTKHFILPYAQQHMYFTAVDPKYQMDLVKNVFTKIPLIIDLTRYSLIGAWDLILHDRPFYEWSMIVVFGLVMAFFFIRRITLFNLSAFNVFVQKLIFACIFFFLANAPALMAVNYTTVGGYRTFLASSLMGLGLIVYCLKYIHSSLQNNVFKKIAKYSIGVYFLSIVLVAGWTICQSVRNYCREYGYINGIASHIDYSKVHKIVIVINRPGESVIKYDLPFEFGYMTAAANHVRYIFDKYDNHASLEFSITFIDWPHYVDDSTEIVDLTLLRGRQRITYAKPANTVRVSTSGQNIVVQQIDNVDGGPLLKFVQRENGDFWQIKPGISAGSVEYHFMDASEMIIGYRLEAACMNVQARPCNFLWFIQGSVDNNKWYDLSLQRWNTLAGNLEGNTFIIPRYFPLKYLRFSFQKQNANDLLILAAIQLKDIQVQR